MDFLLTSKGMVVKARGDLTASQAAHLQEDFRALGPLPEVTIDLPRGGLSDASLGALASALIAAGAVKIELRGASLHQARLLEYCLSRTGIA